MSSNPELKLDWCSYGAAKYAVEHWHYSRTMPASKTVKVGVWEAWRFVGVIIFSMGATPHISRPFGLKDTEVCELTRVALREHRTPVSRMLARAVKMLQHQSPGIRLIVSYADSKEGHHGGIYQAAGWIYLGASEKTDVIVIQGKHYHPRSVGSRYGTGGQSIPWLRKHVDPHAYRLILPPKHKYVMPLDGEARDRLLPLAQPYPKPALSESNGRPKDSSEPSSPRLEEGGAAPTRTLQVFPIAERLTKIR